MNATATSSAYRNLLAEVAPTAIHTEAENEEAIAQLECLTDKERLTTEEALLAELLAVLIEDFKEKHYQLKPATPVEALTELMAARNLRQKDLLDIFGQKSIVSEVLQGKRSLTTEHIRKLSEKFHVSPAVFI